MAQHPDYDTTQRHTLHLDLNMKEVDALDHEELGIPSETQPAVPTVCGMPLKYVSLVTLAVQNALLTLIMHYSRVSAAPSETYSAAAAVLMTELLKGFISLVVAFSRLDCSSLPSASIWNPRALLYRFRRLGREVFRSDCWKLSIPAILYVIQNNLQFVAVSNLDAATFQVSYQMKILTTAAFSVILLRRRLSPTKWLALLFLAIGVGIVQIQTGSSSSSSAEVPHEMVQLKGFMAVVAACFTSGLAGVYFEMVLKNSPADLWVRNVQLSLFSLLPALLPIIFSKSAPSASAPGVVSLQLFANFGVWAWATVCVQVVGGLLTALVIKYADNILKGFATSLSIVISFLASVALFNFPMTLTFILGSTVVLVSTWMYNQPDAPASDSHACKSWSWRWGRLTQPQRSSSGLDLGGATLSRRASTSSLSSLASLSSVGGQGCKSYPGSPVERDTPSLGQLLEKNLLLKKKQDDPSRLADALSAFRPLRSAARLFSRASSPNTHPHLVAANSIPPTIFATSEQPYVFPSQSQAPAYHPQPIHASSLTSSLSYPPVSSRPPSALSSHTHPASRPASAMGHATSLSVPIDFVQSHIP